MRFKHIETHCCPQLPLLLPEEIRDLHIMQLTVRVALLGSVKRAEGTSNCVYRRAVKPGDVLQVKSACCIIEDTISGAVIFSFWRISDTLWVFGPVWSCLVLFGPVWPCSATLLGPHAGFCGPPDNFSYKIIHQYAVRDAVCVTADVCHGSCRQPAK